MSYNSSYIDIYKKYISQGWYETLIPTATLERWKGNFDTSNDDSFDVQICSHFLLYSLIFYQEKHVNAIIRHIQNLIKSDFNQSTISSLEKRLDDSELNDLWQQYKDECFIVAAAKPEATADSAHQASRCWRNETGIEVGSILSLLDKISQGKKHIFFVDDFIGTGTKMKGFLSDNLFPKNNTYGFQTVDEIIRKHSPNVDFNIAVFAIHDCGKNFLRTLFPSIKVFYGDLFDEKYDLLSDQCILYEAFSDVKQYIIDYLSEKQNELDGENSFALNLPICFHQGCPNNTLSLYYKNTDEWARLIPESHPTV